MQLVYRNSQMKVLTLAAAIATVIGAGTAFGEAGYVTGDFHQHSKHSDGSVLEATVNASNVTYGLDWWANSEHGGGSGGQYRWQDIGGYTPTYKGMANTWIETQNARALYTNKTIIQGLEMNTPGHEHTSTGIITGQYDLNNPNAHSMAEFEYRFDSSDGDTSGGPGGIWTNKNTSNTAAKTIQAVQWLNTYHPTTSWFIPSHDERQNKWSVKDFRDINNAAPTVAFGFESMPGHQGAGGRGGYGTSARGGGTYGGCGVDAAKVGGMWDSLLGEGRNWQLFASSDFHAYGDDFWPGQYQKTYTYTPDKSVIANSTSGAGAQAVVDSLRSGNSWVVEGDLINSLEFKANGSINMGDHASVMVGSDLTISIKVHDQVTRYDDARTLSSLNHIDLIAGDVTGLIDPGSSDYANKATNSSTRVIARYDALGNVVDSNGLVSSVWTDLGGGWKEMTFTLPNYDGNQYFRLRGSNLGKSVAGETDGAFNPLVDPQGSNMTKAWADTWFYSNAIFVQAVPEPTTLALLAVAGLMGLRRRA